MEIEEELVNDLANTYSTIIVDLNSDNEDMDSLLNDPNFTSPSTSGSSQAKKPQARRGRFAKLLPVEAPFICPSPNCDAVFPTRYKLRRHFRNHQERKHACNYCNQKFLYLKDKRTHERIHTGERPFVCQVCHRGFVQKCTLANHLITHNKAEKEEVCDLCGKAYYYKKSLAQHKKEKHSTLQKVYHCASCGKQYTGRSGYCIHLRKCAKAEKTLHTCTDCGRTYQRIDILEKHKMRCSGRIYQCGVCDKTLITEENLSKHMCNVHDISYEDCIQVHVDGNLEKQQRDPTAPSSDQPEVFYEAYGEEQDIDQLIASSQPTLGLSQATT